MGSPKAPEIKPPPAPPKQPDTSALEEQRRRLRRRLGMRGTFATTPSGLSTRPATTIKTLLGQ